MASHITNVEPAGAYALAPVGPAGADWQRADAVDGPAGMAHPARLTRRQVQIVGFVAEYTGRHGYPPSLREVSRAVGLSPNNVSSVFRHIAALIGQGILARSTPSGARHARAITLAEPRRAAG
ncbi:LexA family protein [Phytohabitans houttuyneae]|uniref:LexA repressor DNA-binding domain-containing protein n=1 Tax=Phytohabitans houttuyneae TaxID=1076126 RepID=A0A6V8KCW3_9ACTN|nr:hypothetical protein [Phytohabitans houttuyneae]GFJ79527.1 hypothetical protein Phou_037070 [Phytohabitans houttuyneae]